MATGAMHSAPNMTLLPVWSSRDRSERGHLTSDPADLVAVANELLRGQWNSRWPKRPKWLSRRIHGAHPPQI
jgi:hypothetical protein